MHPKVLIVGTSPYDKQGPARAFESYFSGWERDNLVQIFSSPNKPKAGHCSKLYQVTDAQMLKRWLSSKKRTGLVYKYEELLNIDTPTTVSTNEVSSGIVSKLYKIGKKKTSLIYILRGILWKKKYWCTKELDRFVDDFKPECIFLAFSDDYFILQIALHYAQKYDIPIVSCIGDDYYFNVKKTISPFYWIYKKTYKKLVRRIFAHGGSAAYIGDKIRDKYNKEFNLNGRTVYLTSEIVPHEFRPINTERPKIIYCGNIRLGRNNSLDDIGRALSSINSSYYLDVYSNESDETVYRNLKKNPNIRYHGAIPYTQVMAKIRECDIAVVVEGFDPADVETTRYSLSTKVADSLATGSCVLAYGSKECGAIDYVQSIGCVTVCTSPKELEAKIKGLISDISLQKANYTKAMEIINRNHRIENSTRIFTTIVNEVIKEYKAKGK